MPDTVLLRVTRTFDVLVDMKRGQVADMTSRGDQAKAIFIPGSTGEREAIAILVRDKRFRLKEG